MATRIADLAAALLLSTGAVTCFTGDGLVNQPCESDEDCNPDADLLGRALRCVESICGYVPRCGDGIVDESEACDDGDDDNTDACLNTCAAAACGDDLVQAGVEQCDDGNRQDDDGCSSACRHEGCGDGVVQSAEDCDDGDLQGGDGCSASCTFESCGDELVQGQEQCDDGNAVNTDACVGCKLAACGDGVTQEDVEACDDGNDSDEDACLVACALATCGDGHVWAGVEACDDGDADDGDECLAACVAARCGDGVVQVGVEACDDGDADDGDPCRTDCALNTCGDGVVDVTREGCDDQNTDDNDGCSNACQQGAVALGSGPIAAHMCAVRAGRVRCWGYNAWGMLGYGNSASLGDEANELPALLADVPAEDPGTTVVRVAAGSYHTCVLLDDHRVRCWGRGLEHQLGFELLGNQSAAGDEPGELPTPAVSLGEGAIDVVAGGIHTCALLGTGVVRCWGSNEVGQLGIPEVKKYSPEDVGPVDVGGVAQQITAGDLHTCALLVAGSVRCWGTNEFGQLGYPDLDFVGYNETPASVVPVDIGGPAVQIAAGGRHTCALLASGDLRCWGWNVNGQLGVASTATIGDDETPAQGGAVTMLQPGDSVLEVTPGARHTCVLLAGDGVRCWGYADYIGYGGASYGASDATPPLVDLGGETILDLVSGTDGICALLAGGALRCFGNNTFGLLGINATHSVGDMPGEMPPAPSPIYPNP